MFFQPRGRPGRPRAAVCTVLALLPLAACSRPAPAPVPANVVLISVDTLRADHLNTYGYGEHAVSPAIDRLAGDGITFEQHIAASPWTTPSHMSLLTSLHPSTHGVHESFLDMRWGLRTGRYQRLAEARTTLAEALKAEGHATAAFTGGITLLPEIGFGQGFERFETSMYKLDERNFGEMLSWLDEHADVPFFLFFHTFEVHSPFLHPDFLDAKHAALLPELRAMAPELTDPDGHMTKNQTFRRFLKKNGLLDRETVRDLYAGGVRSMDGWVARLVGRLEELGLYDRTLIVFTSDHGEELAEHDPRNLYDKHGHTAYEEIVRVPLVIKLPQQRSAGTRVTALTRAIDVMPTVLDVLGVTAGPDEMQGRSLAPLWQGEEGTGERTAFIESAVTPAEIKSVRTETHKLVVETSKETVRAHGRNFIPRPPEKRMLFDLRADPGERRDLLATADPAALALADRMESELRAWVAAQESDLEEVDLDPTALERLEALGYVDPGS